MIHERSLSLAIFFPFTDLITSPNPKPVGTPRCWSQSLLPKEKLLRMVKQ